MLIFPRLITFHNNKTVVFGFESPPSQKKRGKKELSYLLGNDDYEFLLCFQSHQRNSTYTFHWIYIGWDIYLLEHSTRVRVELNHSIWSSETHLPDEIFFACFSNVCMCPRAARCRRPKHSFSGLISDKIWVCRLFQWQTVTHHLFGLLELGGIVKSETWPISMAKKGT